MIRPKERGAEREESPDEGRDSRFAGAIVKGSRGADWNVRDRLEGIVADGEVTRVAGRITDDGGLTLVGGGTSRKATRG